MSDPLERMRNLLNEIKAFEKDLDILVDFIFNSGDEKVIKMFSDIMLEIKQIIPKILRKTAQYCAKMVIS